MKLTDFICRIAYKTICKYQSLNILSVYIMPASVIVRKNWWVKRSMIEMYSESDPCPPKSSVRYCFDESKNQAFKKLSKISEEMNDSRRSIIHNTIKAIFLDKIDPKSTPEYKSMANSVERGIDVRGCKTIADIDRYFKKMNELYIEISLNGYKSQHELDGNLNDEIRLHVDSIGRLCLGSKGNHRFRIAELLNVEYVPCNVQGVSKHFLLGLCDLYTMPPHLSLNKWYEDHSGFEKIKLNTTAIS